jgi:hypothetical protein
MKLVLIEEFPVTIVDFENVPAQPAAYGIGSEQIITANTIFLGQELDANNHDTFLLPPLANIPNRTAVSNGPWRHGQRQGMAFRTQGLL